MNDTRVFEVTLPPGEGIPLRHMIRGYLKSEEARGVLQGTSIEESPKSPAILVIKVRVSGHVYRGSQAVLELSLLEIQKRIETIILNYLPSTQVHRTTSWQRILQDDNDLD